VIKASGRFSVLYYGFRLSFYIGITDTIVNTQYYYAVPNSIGKQKHGF